LNPNEAKGPGRPLLKNQREVPFPEKVSKSIGTKRKSYAHHQLKRTKQS